jgi:DNA polymerase
MSADIKQAKLDQIRADILEENICPDLAKTAKQLVMGDGNPDADIVFIGEAPGKKEDEQGIPFVGASGKFLNEMLSSIGLERSDIYITNIVKYRPPNNRDPREDEKAAFLPYLEEQLEVIQPKIVITLGRHSMNCFLPDLLISEVHGQPQRARVNFGTRVGRSAVNAMQGDDEQRTEPYQEYAEGAAESLTQQRFATWLILPLYHPAAALYNGALRQTLIDDFKRIPLIIK